MNRAHECSAPVLAAAPADERNPTRPIPPPQVVGGGALASCVRQVAATMVPAAPAVCVVARIPPPVPLAELTDEVLATGVSDALEEVLASVREALATLRGGRLVFVLPGAPLMAAAGSSAASAVTNGVLSMARTLSIELARDSVTVNVIALDAEAPSAAALTAQLSVLLSPGGEDITGQEIYLTAGTDLGRMRP